MGPVRLGSGGSGAMALRHLMITAAMAVVVLWTGQALADDSSAPGADDGTNLVIGGGFQAPADDTSTWTNLQHFFSETTLSIGATPLAGDEPNDTDSGYNAYARIGIRGFSVGGHFSRWSESPSAQDDQRSFGFGASYNLDSWTVGIDYTRGNYDEVFLDVGNGDDADVIAFTSSYALRPGVKINGLVEYSEEVPAQDSAADGALTVGIGTLISF